MGESRVNRKEFWVDARRGCDGPMVLKVSTFDRQRCLHVGWADLQKGQTISMSNLEVIKNLYAAFARGDGPAVVGAMNTAIVWNEAEHSIYADRNPYVGPDAIGGGIFFRFATEWDGFQVVPEAFHDAGETIVATGRYHGTYKATGSVVDAQFAHLWTLKDGKVAAFQQYTDTTQPVR